MLNSLKVLDFTDLLPGPFATMMLADMGADILRIEPATKPDKLREVPPFDGQDSAPHNYLSRSKRSLTLDLKQAEAIEIVKKLIMTYDVILETFRPGVMERLGLGYEVLKEINPRLIYCSITGFGRTGPMVNRPGHDNNYLSIAGIASYTGRQNSGPLPFGFQLADVGGGSLHAVISILAAALHREKTGEGQLVDVSMTDSAFTLSASTGAGYVACGLLPEAEKMRLNGGTFYDYYETSDGRYVSVGSLEPQFRQLLCEGIGRPELYKLSMSPKPEDMQEFKQILKDAFLSKTFAQWSEIFDKIEACVDPVLSFAEACEHPQIKARGMLVDVPKDDGSTQRQMAAPVKFSAYTPTYKHVGGKKGADTATVLQELGLSGEKIIELQSKGIV